MAPRSGGGRAVRRGAAPGGGAPRPRVKVWVVLPNGTKLGGGRARLFELIDELGSIRKAVARMGMSYRAAWGYITELEAAAGFAFLIRRPGGGGTGGARLTKEGRAFLARYGRFRDSVDRIAQRRFASAFRDDR
jgi:molybdate transport system regulatory protein